MIALVEPDQGGEALLGRIMQSSHKDRIAAARLEGFEPEEIAKILEVSMAEVAALSPRPIVKSPICFCPPTSLSSKTSR